MNTNDENLIPGGMTMKRNTPRLAMIEYYILVGELRHNLIIRFLKQRQ